MNRKILLKLIISDIALALLVLGYSLLLPFGKEIVDAFDEHYMLYQFLFGQMITIVAFALLVIAFTWATFQITKHCRRCQLVMIVNAVITMAVGIGVGLLLMFCTIWLKVSSLFTFAKIMLWIGPVTIVLSFPLRLLKRKGLVA
jgi:hypothetical protein